MLAKHINYICQSFARLYKDRQCFRISSKGYCLFCKNTCTAQNFRYDFWPKYQKTVHFPSLCDLSALFLIPVRKSDSGAFFGGRFGGVSAVKPSGFRLTKTQLAVRRSGPRLSNNYCVSAHCKAIFLWFAGHFYQIFVAVLPIKGWIYLHNHVTYAHNSGIRRRIYGKSALYMLYCPLMDCYFYTSANGEMDM